jgi:hypothetical protein
MVCLSVHEVLLRVLINLFLSGRSKWGSKDHEKNWLSRAKLWEYEKIEGDYDHFVGPMNPDSGRGLNGVLYSPPGIPAGIRRNPVDSGNSAESNFSSGAC